MHELCIAAVHGDARGAAEIHRRLMPLNQLLFAEPNPIPVKWALARMGRCGGTLRLPMTPMSHSLQPTLEQALRDAGVL